MGSNRSACPLSASYEKVQNPRAGLSRSVRACCVCALDVIERGVSRRIVAVARARSVILSAAKDRGLIASVAGSGL
jgi:hypothetical protein